MRKVIIFAVNYITLVNHLPYVGTPQEERIKLLIIQKKELTLKE